MKVTFTSPNGRISYEVECPTPQAAIQKLAVLGEAFNEVECGQCHSKDIYFTYRNPDNNAYYGMRCRSCGADLWIHQNRDGIGLYIKRDEGKNGWTPKFTRKDDGGTAPSQTKEKKSDARRDPQPEPAETPF